MMQSHTLFLNPAGQGEAPMPAPEALSGGWNVNALSIIHNRSSAPLAYGISGVLANGFAVVASLTPTHRRTIVDGACVFDGWAPAGAARIQRPGERVFTEIHTGFDQVAIYIPAQLFETILREQGAAATRLDIIDPMWRADAVIESSLRCAAAALPHRSAASFAYLQNVARALAAHVLYWHSSAGAPQDRAAPESAALAAKLAQVTTYIERNLDRRLTLQGLAAIAGLPPDQFRRAFKDFAKDSPYQFIIQRRIERACAMLASPVRAKLSEIALECGFADQSHLSATFRRVLGVSPARYLPRG